MKNTLFLVFLLFALAVSGTENSVIGFQDKPEMTVLSVTVDAEEKIDCVLPGGKTVSFPKGEYSYVWIPMPPEIAAADKLLLKDPSSAVTDFTRCYERYKLLGWDVYTLYRKADALSRANLKNSAVQELKKIVDYKIRNPRLYPVRSEANILLLSLALETKNFALAEERVAILKSSEDSLLASYAYLMRARLLRMQGREADARRELLHAYILFPESRFYIDILSGIVLSLKAEKDPKAEKFEKILQKEQKKKP